MSVPDFDTKKIDAKVMASITVSLEQAIMVRIAMVMYSKRNMVNHSLL